ncbi:hypothetical protein CAXC1_310023 [Candidatus Xenohaliotis californiensis]|uniref:Uncharacterized protein n=1 Tax=Candidatus Xenohaliotis californiensis TaxID=84677 RepID=A0ABM9N962_9RICK|nr:hypothetical protein CAXC1_310023 [Candidatus Xenohaliotis californiensis]
MQCVEIGSVFVSLCGIIEALIYKYNSDVVIGYLFYIKMLIIYILIFNKNTISLLR